MGRRHRRHHAAVAMMAGLVALTAGCASTSGPFTPAPVEPSVSLDVTDSTATGSAAAAPAGTRSATTSGAATTAPRPSNAPAEPATASAVLAAAVADGSLRGKVVVIDPGHNGANGRNTRVINRKVNIANGVKACDTTGTETNAGFSESAFNFDVSTRLAALLRSAGATVILTRPDNRGVGPCIDQRAAIGNQARAHAAISIHADGAPARGYGFHIIVPEGIGGNNAIVAPSRQLGVQVRDAFRATGEPLSTYTGTRTGGLVARTDLGGLNLSAVPKVFIECGNMRNTNDARRLTSPAWRQRAAVALAAGLTAYLTGKK